MIMRDSAAEFGAKKKKKQLMGMQNECDTLFQNILYMFCITYIPKGHPNWNKAPQLRENYPTLEEWTYRLRGWLALDTRLLKDIFSL